MFLYCCVRGRERGRIQHKRNTRTHARRHVPVLEKAGAVACSCTGTSTISIAAHHISISILQPIKVIVGELQVVFPVSSKMVSESFLDRMLTLVARSLTGRYRSLLVVLVASGGYRSRAMGGAVILEGRHTPPPPPLPHTVPLPFTSHWVWNSGARIN